MAQRSLLLFLRGALRLLQRRRRRLAQPPAGIGELVRLLIPLLPRPRAAASEAATASSSIAALLLSVGLRRLARDLLLAVDGAEGRGPLPFPDLDDEAARQLVLGVVLARLRAGRARIHADAAAGEAALAPPANAIDDIYHDAGAGGILVFVHALLRLAPPPAGPAEQVASEAATATCSIIALLLAVDGVLGLDDPRAGRLLICVFLAWVRARHAPVHAAAVPGEAALAPDDAPQNADEDPDDAPQNADEDHDDAPQNADEVPDDAPQNADEDPDDAPQNTDEDPDDAPQNADEDPDDAPRNTDEDPDDAPQNAHEDPIAADKPDEEEKMATVVVSTVREALEAVRLWDEGGSMMVDVPAHLQRQDAVDIDDYLSSRGATPAVLRRGPVLNLILTGAGGQ